MLDLFPKIVPNGLLCPHPFNLYQVAVDGVFVAGRSMYHGFQTWRGGSRDKAVDFDCGIAEADILGVATLLICVQMARAAIYAG